MFRGEISPRMTGCVVIKAWNVLFQAAAESQPRPFAIILHYSHPQRKLAGNDLFPFDLQGQMQSVQKFPVSSFQNTTLPRIWLTKSPADGTSDARMAFVVRVSMISTWPLARPLGRFCLSQSRRISRRNGVVQRRGL